MLHLKGRRTGVAELAFSPDGSRLLAAGRGGVHVWDLRDPGAKPVNIPTCGVHAPVGLAVFSDGRVFFTEPDGVRVFAPDGGEVLGPPVPPSSAFYGAPSAPDGSRVAGLSRWAHSPLTVWRLRGAGPSLEWSGGPDRRVRAAAFSPDSARLAAAESVIAPLYWVTALTVRDAATGATLATLRPPTAVPDQLLFSPDGGRLVARSGQSLTVYDLAAPGDKPRRVANPDRPHFSAAAFHPGGRLFATVTTDRLVRFWDTDAWLPGATFTWDVGKLYAVAFSPDGATCAAGSHTGRVLVWDV